MLHLLQAPKPARSRIAPKLVHGRAGFAAHQAEVKPSHPPRLQINAARGIQRALRSGNYSSQAELAKRFGATRSQVEYMMRRIKAQGLQ